MKKNIFAISIFLFVLTFLTKPASAQEANCRIWEDATNAVTETSVESTFLGTMSSVPTGVTFFLAGQNSCDAMTTGVECVVNKDLEGCQIAPEASSNSTILGLTGKMRAMTTTEDLIPVNFAYYFRDQVKHVPVVGEKVYAQESYGDIWGAPLALEIWKAFRNIALGLMSIFLIVIGIFIIMRKKADPKTVLTLQAALPKVIISMVLIVFSFAIGALFIRFIGPLKGMADTVFGSVTGDLLADPGTATETIMLAAVLGIVGIVAGTLAGGPVGGVLVGTFAIFMGPIVGLVWIGVLLATYIRIVIIYVKLLLKTVTAPLTFAIGAIPGNDDAIIKWFKQMLALLLSIPAMFFLISLAEFVPKYAVENSLIGTDISGYSGTFIADIVKSNMQQLLLLMITPFISIMLLIQALGAPKKIEAYIVGEPKKR